ncbi:MAG: caspase family protein, partial [Bacteroidota bacterium]
MSHLKNNESSNRSGRDELGIRQPTKPIGKSWFLGIGIDAYRYFSPLNNAVRDVKAIAEVLQQDYDLESGQCRFLLNDAATRRGILKALRGLVTEIKEDDKLIIYYSGHGSLNARKRGFWVPVDAEKGEEETYVSNGRLRELIADIHSRHTLLISDSCFSGTFFVRGASRSDLAADELESRVSRWAICSGRSDEEVADGAPGGHSPFCASILNELKLNQNAKLRVASLADRVVEVTRANYEQLPEGNPLQGVGHMGGQYVFHRRSTDA